MRQVLLIDQKIHSKNSDWGWRVDCSATANNRQVMVEPRQAPGETEKS
jgi:hypothetical protein